MTSAFYNLFQETLQSTTHWLREIAESVPGIDEQQAYHLLCATLRGLRDRMPVEEAVQLGAQLPVLVRGLYYDGWRPAEVPVRIRSAAEFIANIATRYHARPLANFEDGVRAVLATLSRNVDFGETFSLLRALPHELRELFPEHIVRAA
jgi:uncharacterized protein (DUF2267 family)